MIISEILLDKPYKGWYNIQARVGGICGFFRARDAMMREIALKDGNFRGVCPVIGRLNCFCRALAYIAGREEGAAAVGHFSWLGMIRTAARTTQFDRTQTSKQTEYVKIKEENKPWQTRK